MSKIACHCGAVLSNTLYPAQGEGELRTDQDHEYFEEAIEKAVADFRKADSQGRRGEWLADFFDDGYPRDLPEYSVTSDIRARFETQFFLAVSECESCGRLYIQRRPGENAFVCFEPRSGHCERILQRKKTQQDLPAALRVFT